MLEFMEDRNQEKKVLRERKRKGFSTTASCCKNKNGDLIKNKGEVLMQCKYFFKELLNGNESRMPLKEIINVIRISVSEFQPVAPQNQSWTIPLGSTAAQVSGRFAPSKVKEHI
uniref:Uncharacterized protein n=1 Tax=Megaselia scalaris TaxID=36166 RepID=T1GTE7_MEGSC